MSSLRQAAARLGGGWEQSLGRWGPAFEGKYGGASGYSGGFSDVLRRISSQVASTSAPTVAEVAASAAAKPATGRRSPFAIYSKLSKAKLSLLVVATAAGGALFRSSWAMIYGKCRSYAANLAPYRPERRHMTTSLCDGPSRIGRFLRDNRAYASPHRY